MNTLSQNDINQEQSLLIEAAKSAALKAYAPYSHFQVGAAVLLENGEIITGSNQENAVYGESICAERVALLYACSTYPDIAPKSIAITAFHHKRYKELATPPCGSCRQVIREMEIRFKTKIDIIMYGTKQTYYVTTCEQLLPLSFESSTMENN